MVDKQSVRPAAIIAGLEPAIFQTGRSYATFVTDVIEAAGVDENGKPHLTKQAVYKWRRKGEVADDNLRVVARLLAVQEDPLVSRGEFLPEEPSASPSETGKESDIPSVIYRKVRRLDTAAQGQVLSLIETMINIADPNYWKWSNQEAERPKKTGRRSRKTAAKGS